MTLKFEIDERKFRADAIAVKGGLKAARDTAGASGTGEVFTGRRAPDDFDSETAGRPPWPAWRITRFLRSKGFDPFDLPTGKTSKAEKVFSSGVERAIVAAYESGIAQQGIARTAVQRATMILRDEVKKTVLSGSLERNTAQYRKHKKNLQARGLIGSRWGRPPPYGILTGRWYRAISARWRPGDL